MEAASPLFFPQGVGGMNQIDDRDLFQEATFAICGSLDVNKALNKFKYILPPKGIPVDGTLLYVYNPENAMTEIVAGFLPGIPDPRCKIYFPPDVSRKLNKISMDVRRKTTVEHIERCGDDELGYPIVEKFGLEDASALHMWLIIEGQYIGSVTLINLAGGTFNDTHARLLQLLNEPFSIALSNFLRYREVIGLKDMLEEDNRFLKEQLGDVKADGIVGAGLGLMGVMEKVNRVSRSDSPVLLLGETGTGKELIAAAIHNNSKRGNMPFIKVNCGAIPDTLIDSELFGHEKGAFTGATAQKKGRFERADRGTIFLDEIGELPLSAQVRLLRVLQDNEIERVGGSRPLKLDIRIIAATHRDLEKMIREEKFRDDLYFRLNVFPIRVPPLRDRLEDIPYLTTFFIKKKCRDMGVVSLPGLGTGEIELLKSYRWPGNVRELENIVERAVLLRDSGKLSFKGLLKRNDCSDVTESIRSSEEVFNLDEINLRHIQKVLQVAKGKIYGPKGAAALLGIKPSTLRARMDKLNIAYRRKLRNEYK
jgi:transcriptional regulator with GAF, ATPase, and Fis domain